MYCENCGTLNPKGARFCSACGESMEYDQIPYVPQEQWDQQPVEQPVQQWDQQPVEQPVQQWDQQPVEQPVQQWDQQRVEQPVQQWDQQPVEQPVQQWDQQPVEQSIQQRDQQPVQQQWDQQIRQGGYAPPPAYQLKTNRSLAKMFFLSLITLGIYGIVVMSNVSTSINMAAGRYDGRKTMHYCLVVFIFSWLTLGIVPLVWYHKLSGRIGRELRRRNIRHNFGAKDFWLWCVLGSLIIAGPFIYYHKLLKGMNLICRDYNQVG